MTRFYHNYTLYCRINSVLTYNTKILFTASLTVMLILITSCEENPTKIGKDMLPGSDFVDIRSNNAIGVEGYTRYVDSIVTNNRTYSYLGGLYDPYFGDTKSDFVSQLRLAKKWPGGGPFAVDSCKFYFSIVGAKGAIDSTNREIRLFEITETLSSTGIYYSNRDPNAGMDLGTYTLPIISKDTIQSFVIVLPPSFGTYLMRDTTKLTQDDDANDFRSFFKGLYITMVDHPSPLMIAQQFTNADCFIRVFYHNLNSGVSLTYDFVINANSVRYNRYGHNFASAEPDKKIKHINDGVLDSSVYLQAFNGVFPHLRIPGLKSYKDSLNLSVNKARLTFSVFLDEDTYSKTNIPTQILMKYTKADTAQYIVPDYQVSTTFFDGKFNTTKNTYSFNLAAFVQEYFKGNIPSTDLEMYLPDGEYQNVILKANNSTSPVKFEFTYTRF